MCAHVFDSISTTALEVGLRLGSCTQQSSITFPMKCTSWLSEGIGGRPPSRTVNITELSFFFDENGILSVKIYAEGIQDFSSIYDRSNSNLDKGHRKGVDITFKCEWAARVRNWLKVFLRTHDFRCCPSARTRSLEGCEFRGLDQKW